MQPGVLYASLFVWHTIFGSLFPNQPFFCLNFSCFFIFKRLSKCKFIKLMTSSASLICYLANTLCLAFQRDMVATSWNSLAESYIHVYWNALTLSIYISLNYARWHKIWVFSLYILNAFCICRSLIYIIDFITALGFCRLFMHSFALFFFFCRLKLCCLKLLSWHRICLILITPLDLSAAHSRIIKELWVFT